MGWQFTDPSTGLTSEKAMLINQYGNRTLLRPENGVYTLTLPGTRCDDNDGCAIGGVVSTLVQPEGESAVVELSGNTQTELHFSS